MNSRAEFMEKLQALVQLARQNDSSISVDKVQEYFGEEVLSEEQMTLVFDYLLSQKIVVKGYLKLQDEVALELDEEEKAYLAEYEKDIQAVRAMTDAEREELFDRAVTGDETAKKRLAEGYLREVLVIAKQMNHADVFLGDLIQEGNLGAVLSIEMLDAACGAHDAVLSGIRQAMQVLIEEHEEAKHRDNKMVEKVADLDAAITELTEELGRKITIDELALHMGLTEDEIDDIMTLTGEERESSEHHHHEEDNE